PAPSHHCADNVRSNAVGQTRRPDVCVVVRAPTCTPRWQFLHEKFGPICPAPGTYPANETAHNLRTPPGTRRSRRGRDRPLPPRVGCLKRRFPCCPSGSDPSLYLPITARVTTLTGEGPCSPPAGRGGRASTSSRIARSPQPSWPTRWPTRLTSTPATAWRRTPRGIP